MTSVLAFLAICLLFVPVIASAEPDSIFISISNSMDKSVFDGKWTTQTEWKNSSWRELKFDNATIQLRIAHQEDFIYVLLDAVNDNTKDKLDGAVLCIDSKNNKNSFVDNDDFCFKARQGSSVGETLQGNNSESGPVMIPNPVEFTAAGNTSDENDRYTAIPHASYEFKIPTDFIGRSDNYGFFVSVFDESNQMYYNWPTNATKTPDVPSPQLWGDLVSPDKSLPEFDLPLLVLLPSLVLVFYLTRIKSKL